MLRTPTATGAPYQSFTRHCLAGCYRVATIDKLTHGYHGRLLFKDTSLEITKGDRIAIIGPNGAGTTYPGPRTGLPLGQHRLPH
jgi:ABC-type cobalamin/Fe3+-siderophores transport system ATPase subunit